MVGKNFGKQIVNFADAAAQQATVTIHTPPSSIAMMDDLNCEAA
jgi:hypothetical protein